MIAHDLFSQMVMQALKDRPKSYNEWWRHRLVFKNGKAHCEYCGVAIQVRKGGPDTLGCMDHLVSVYHGGPQRTENLVPACYSCNIKKKSSDLLLWAPRDAEDAPLDTLSERRMQMLAWSDNHLLRNPNLGKRKDTVVRHLTKRWQHPRILVWAALTEQSGFISLVGPNMQPQDTVPMLRHLGARPADYASFTIEPTRFHDAIWALIDHNALVRRIELPGHPDPTPEAPGDAQWHVTFSSVLDVRRRRPKIKPIRKPRIERPMDWGKRLLLEYEACGRDGRPYDWEWVNSHKETDLAWEREERKRAMQRERELREALATLSPSLSIDDFFQELDRRIASPGPEDTLERLAREHGIQVNGGPSDCQG